MRGIQKLHLKILNLDLVNKYQLRLTVVFPRLDVKDRELSKELDLGLAWVFIDKAESYMAATSPPQPVS